MQQTLQESERAYWEQRLGADVPLNSVGFHGLSDSFVWWLYRLRERRFGAAIKPFARPGLRVVDIGSGGGFYLKLWERAGVRDLTATDLTQASLDAISKRFPGVTTARFDVGDDTVPLPEGSFDAISCMDVVHHLMEDSQYDTAMRNFARLLKPGGVLIFTDNFLHGPVHAGPHSVSRPLAQIQRSLEAAGFEIVRRRPMFVLMNNPVDSRSRLHKFFWKAASFISENRILGFITGMLLYPFEVALTSLLREGPSTELCIARKR